MTDFIDQTEERTEREMQILIDAARRPAIEVRDTPAGECRNGCGEAVDDGGSYCSADCCKDHDSRKQLRKRQGSRT